MTVVGLSFLIGLSQAVAPLPTIEVTVPKDVALVESVNDAMTELSRKVTACVEAGGKTETCRCSDPHDLTALRKGYAALIEHHPEWRDQLLSYRSVNKDGRNVSGTLVMPNLRRQLDDLRCK